MKISKIETASNSGGKVNEEERDFIYDLRLARRWKRRRIASENFRFNCSSHKASKKTVNSDIKNNKNNGSVAEVVVIDSDTDSDFEEFLNDMVQYVEVGSDDECADNGNGADKDGVGEVLDPDYMVFLENLKEDGKSYVLELALSNGTSVVVRYEEENDSINGLVRCKQENDTRNGLGMENLEDHQSEENIETENILSLMAVENVKTVAEDHVSYSANDFSGKRCRSNFVGENYLQFLNSSMKDGQNLLLTPEGGNKTAKDEDEGSTSDSEVIILDNDPILAGKHTPFESSKFCGPCVVIDDDKIMECHGREESQFREKLMEYLQKPFDITECEALLRDASQRRPKQGARELRGRTVVFPVDSDIASYLELHDSLAKKVYQAGRDRRKILNLLRGFFFWLENLCKKRAFLPWMDSQCLSTLPPVKLGDSPLI